VPWLILALTVVDVPWQISCRFRQNKRQELTLGFVPVIIKLLANQYQDKLGQLTPSPSGEGDGG